MPDVQTPTNTTVFLLKIQVTVLNTTPKISTLMGNIFKVLHQ